MRKDSSFGKKKGGIPGIMLAHLSIVRICLQQTLAMITPLHKAISRGLLPNALSVLFARANAAERTKVFSKHLQPVMGGPLELRVKLL